MIHRGIAAPEGVVRRLHDPCSRARGTLHRGIDLGLRVHVVGDAELGRALRAHRQARVVREALARPERQAQATVQVEERHRAVLELLADDALGVPAQPVTIEAHRALELIDTEREQRDARLHGR
jgi:hypothetical protein